MKQAIALAALLLIAGQAAAKDLGRAFNKVSQRSGAPVLAVTRTIVPSNGNEPLTLVYLINCLDQTQASFNVETEKLQVREFPLYKGMIKHSGPSWQSELCSSLLR